MGGSSLTYDELDDALLHGSSIGMTMSELVMAVTKHRLHQGRDVDTREVKSFVWAAVADQKIIWNWDRRFKRKSNTRSIDKEN